MKTKWIPFYLAVLILTSCQPPSAESGVVIDSSEPTRTQPQPTSSDDTGGTEQEQSLFEITENYLVFQIGNNAPAFLLVTEPSQFISDNHIGGWTGKYDLYNNPDFFYQNGFKRIRIGALFGPDQVGWPIRLDTLSPAVDETITEYAENDIKIILTTLIGSGLPFPPNFQNQAQVDTYLEYLAFVTSHFKGRIAYYEILNEPLYMSPKDYVKIAEMAVEVIREIDPDAKIIIGSVCGDWLNDYPGYGEYQRSVLNFMWFFELIQSFNFEDVQVDGISWHPLYDNLPSDPYYQTYPEIIRSFQVFAASRHFSGEYFADEICWVGIDEENWDNGPPTDPAIAAKYQTRAITEHRGLGVNVTINIFWQAPFMNPIKNLNNVLAGAEPAEIPINLETNEDFDHLRAYGFSLPDGDMLVALWINNTAVKEDPGVNFTLTLPDFSADHITGIDVYYGFEQELVAENQDGNLIIENLMVKDYPTLIRFSKPTPQTAEGPKYTQLPRGSVIMVENTADSGPGSFRQALTDAKSGDIITFDPEIFKPKIPATISVLSGLPEIGQGYLTIDASNAGVILDGSGTGAAGFNITSEWNTIRGLHIINFPRPGIILWENASFNTIGGDPQQGAGPFGQGNLITGNLYGIALAESKYNTITGNQIGVELEGVQGNKGNDGVYIEGQSIGNIIGPDNLIVNNSTGVNVYSADPVGSTITRNAIYGNEEGILIDPGIQTTPDAPVIQALDLAGTVSGTTCPVCRVEIFSGEGSGAEIFEGSLIADSEGNFTITADEPFTGPFLVATATTPDGFTSAFSLPIAVE